MWSPYCPGVLLSDCGTTQARELRREIEARAATGDSEDEILDWVREEYGAQAIARPETSGVGLVVWLVPAAIFLAGAALVWRTVSKNTDRRLVHGDQER